MGWKIGTVPLQWGRDVSIPEMVASFPHAVWFNGFNGAGMFLSRKFAFPPTKLAASLGFNGAGMFLSRKCHGQNNGRGSGAGLQWGRDVSIPEMAWKPLSYEETVKLQWGRDVSIPEIATSGGATLGTMSLQWGRDVSIPEMR